MSFFVIFFFRYVKYWKNKLKTTNLKEVCLQTGLKDNSSNDSNPCYILSDAIQEDKELREILNKESLVRVIKFQFAL